MIKKFWVKNFKNFKSKITLDLSKTNNYEFNKEAIRNGIVNTALIYGENGSGKSNLSLALLDVILHLTDRNKNKEEYNYYNYIGCKDSVDFYYEFDFNGDKLEYIYSKMDYDSLIREKIKINGDVVLDYDHFDGLKKLSLKGTESLKTDIGSSSISFVKYVNSNAILEDDRTCEVFKEFMEFVSHMLLFKSLISNTYQGFAVGAESISKGIIERGSLEDFQEFLNNAGLDYQLEAKEINGEKSIHVRIGDETVNFYSIASTGTRSLALFYYWLLRLDNVSFLVIDEFDAFYHNKLAKLVVKTVLKRDAQTILTTHNTSIMSNKVLRPDCLFNLKENTIEAFSHLTDKELREAHNIEKMYKAGAFGE